MEEILNTLIEQSQKEMEEALKKLIRIPSVIDMDSSAEGAPFGRDIRNALNGVIQLGEELGFEVKDYDGYAASIRFGNKENEKDPLDDVKNDEITENEKNEKCTL